MSRRAIIAATGMALALSSAAMAAAVVWIAATDPIRIAVLAVRILSLVL